MNTLLMVVSLIPPPGTESAGKGLAAAVLENLTPIYLLSFVVAGFASLMMWLAYRSIRSEKWIKYFSMSFGALSLNFLLKIFTAGFVDVVLQHTLSIVSNVFGVSAALEILSRRTLFSQRLRELANISNLKKREYFLPALSWTLAALSLIAIPVSYLLHVADTNVSSPPVVPAQSPPPYLQAVVDSPDFIFSALCVFLMGYAIFANLGVRRFLWWARVALFVALIYAILQVAFGLAPLEVYVFNLHSESLKATMILIALPLKFALCAFAYLLVVRFFEILSGLGQLQESEFKSRQDYLASDGVVQSIGQKLSDRALKDGLEVRAGETPPESGFVNLVVRLPGETEKRVACIVWPDYDEDKRPKILDWRRDEKRFSPLSTEVYYPEREKPREWERALPFVHEVLADKNRSEIVWVKDNHQSRASGYDGNMRAVASVAIKVNEAAIGCLQVARLDSHFSQMAIRQIRQIANLLSSAVQSYRELAGLDLMSITFAKRQSEDLPYSEKEASELIADVLHDIFGATITRLHMDFGFSMPQTIYKGGNDFLTKHLQERIDEETRGKKWTEFPDKVTSDYFPRPYKLLKKQWTARITPGYIDKLRYKKDEFVMGHLLFAVDAEEDRYDHPALGTNYLHRRVVSTLASDAYLDFARDYYSDILKTLSKELSKKRLNFEEWFEPIKKVLTEQAGFTWVVVRQRGRKTCFGDEQGLAILQKIKALKNQVTTRRFHPKESPEIKTLYNLNDPEPNCTNHILKLRLSTAQGFIWLGVKRHGFGRELGVEPEPGVKLEPGSGPKLEFPSPWKTFLVHFAQIADASLSRITLPAKFMAHVKEHVEAAQLQAVIARMAATGTILHQMGTMIAGQVHGIDALRNAIALGKMKAEEKEYEEILRAMSASATGMRRLFTTFKNLAKAEDDHPCRLLEAARYACRLFEASLIQRGIKPQIDISDKILVDVSFNVAALALATLVGNSTDAVEDEGLIRIEATAKGDTVLCRVIDDGRGMTPETQSRIFEPKASSKEYGTGVGLYLTSHVLSDNDSSIELTKSDQTGTTFTIRFPAVRKELTV